jgi:hypothetical protein
MDEGKKPSLTYEETPIIEPIEPSETPQNLTSMTSEASRVFGSESPPPAKSEATQHEIPPSQAVPVPPPKTGGGMRPVGTALFFLLLFGLGVWLSSQLRSFFVPAVSEEVPVPTVPLEYIAPTQAPSATPSGVVVSRSSWQTYDVISGVTKKAIIGISYQLPNEVKAPVCDSASCASSGTNLPGGTRFTVAPRGKGQLLPDFRGAILTDAGGKEFTMQQRMMGGVYVYEYTGDFTGRTGGGYTFTNIRGVLMPVSETLAIEFNHFAPAGITTDFASDDALFEEIITTLKTPAATTLPLATPTITPATTSGY